MYNNNTVLIPETISPIHRLLSFKWKSINDYIECYSSESEYSYHHCKNIVKGRVYFWGSLPYIVESLFSEPMALFYSYS